VKLVATQNLTLNGSKMENPLILRTPNTRSGPMVTPGCSLSGNWRTEMLEGIVKFSPWSL